MEHFGDNPVQLPCALQVVAVGFFHDNLAPSSAGGVPASQTDLVKIADNVRCEARRSGKIKKKIAAARLFLDAAPDLVSQGRIIFGSRKIRLHIKQAGAECIEMRRIGYDARSVGLDAPADECPELLMTEIRTGNTYDPVPAGELVPAGKTVYGREKLSGGKIAVCAEQDEREIVEIANLHQHRYFDLEGVKPWPPNSLRRAATTLSEKLSCERER